MRTARLHIGLFLAVFALLSQAFGDAWRPETSSDRGARAARDLGALLGAHIVVCVQVGDHDAPITPGDCDDHCPLCRAGAGDLALLLPSPAATPRPFASARTVAFTGAPNRPPPPPVPTAHAQPRAPPEIA